MVVEFLLSSYSKVDYSMVVQDLRDCYVHHRAPDQGVVRREKWRKTRVEYIILDNISMAMSSDKWMGDTSVSAIESVRNISEVNHCIFCYCCFFTRTSRGGRWWRV